MKIASHRVNFIEILAALGLVYFSLSFLAGETIFEMPNNWFISWMAQIFQQMDKVGFWNVWSGQSHGFSYLYFILWKPAMALADGQYYFALTFTLMWALISIGSLFLSAYLFYKIVSGMWGEEKGLILGSVYIVLFLTMPKWYEVIDTIAIAGLLGAIYCWFRGHNKLGGVVLGITAAFKPIGLVILPVILKSEFLSWKSRATIIAASIISFVALILPLALGNFKIFMSSFNWQSGRPPWETVYSFLLWLSKQPYTDNPFFHDGSGVNLQDWAQTGITPSPSLLTTPVPNYHSWYSAVFLILLVVVMITFALSKRVRNREDVLSGTLCMLAAYFALFYGWSLNFVFWLVPFLLIAFRPLVAISLRLIVLLEYPFFYALYMSVTAPSLVAAAPGLTIGMTTALGPIGVVGYWALIFIRTIFILAVGVLTWKGLPTQLWNPVTHILESTMIGQKLKLRAQINRGGS